MGPGAQPTALTPGFGSGSCQAFVFSCWGEAWAGGFARRRKLRKRQLPEPQVDRREERGQWRECFKVGLGSEPAGARREWKAAAGGHPLLPKRAVL